MVVLLTIRVGLLACGVKTCSLGRSFTNSLPGCVHGDEFSQHKQESDESSRGRAKRRQVRSSDIYGAQGWGKTRGNFLISIITPSWEAF